jgi:O-antigen/teichoic acid export membrane protein
LKRLSSVLGADRHLSEVVGGASVALAFKGMAAVLTFAANALLARALGPQGTGIYFQSLTVTTIAAIQGRAGLGNALVRFTAAGAAKEDWSLVRGAYRKGLCIALITSGLAALGMYAASPWIAVSLLSESGLITPMRWMSLAVAPVALGYLYAQLLKGIRKIGFAVLVESLMIPMIWLPGVLVLSPLRGVEGAVWAYIAAALLNLAIGAFLWRRSSSRLQHAESRFKLGQLLESAAPLYRMDLFQMAIHWSPILMLGIWEPSSEVGIFAAAYRTAALSSLMLVAVNSISAPLFAGMYQRGDFEGLEKTARHSASLMAVAAAPFLAVFMLAPKWIMGIFGAPFEKGAILLCILAIGHYINVATGSVGHLLIMCGYERTLSRIAGVNAAICLGLNMLLIPPFGAAGAAVATAATMIAQNLMALLSVQRHLGISTLPMMARAERRRQKTNDRQRITGYPRQK